MDNNESQTTLVQLQIDGNAWTLCFGPPRCFKSEGFHPQNDLMRNNLLEMHGLYALANHSNVLPVHEIPLLVTYLAKS